MADEEITDEQAIEEEYPSGALVFRTLPHAGAWTCSAGDRYVDVTVVKKPTKALVRDVGHAHAAGVVEVLQGLDLTGVQSQEDGEAAYEAAVADGRWHEGQALQAAVEAEARERGDVTIVVEVSEEEGS